MKQIVTAVLLTLFVSAGSRAESLAWPQFRGPNASGVATGQKPPVEFGPTKNVKWKVPAPSGNSSPIIAGNLLVITAYENKKLYTVAYNRADGKEACAARPGPRRLSRSIEPREAPPR